MRFFNSRISVYYITASALIKCYSVISQNKPTDFVKTTLTKNYNIISHFMECLAQCFIRKKYLWSILKHIINFILKTFNKSKWIGLNVLVMKIHFFHFKHLSIITTQVEKEIHCTCIWFHSIRQKNRELFCFQNFHLSIH